ncbi:MAG: UDP-N-acetylglucosamine 2-epimerase [Planctomycetes bacterium]|nr:UDP-N-acetylglucosamine 2-epimerase [Planctomycetota bacterium]
MIHVFIGTKAQFIKMAPVMVEMRARDIPFRYVDSGQHAQLTQSLRRVFGLPEPDVFLRRQEGDIVTIPSAVHWYFKHLWASMLQKKWLKEKVFPEGGVCLIHGDTLSTLLGMQMARAAGLDVAHVEAGLRSFRIWDPFPEELIRIRCMRRSRLLFAPSDEAAANLTKMKVRGTIVKIGGNTVADSLRLTDDMPNNAPIPDEPFALVTCHRLETIRRKGRLAQVVDLVNRVARQIHVIFVMHKPTRKSLARYGLEARLHPNVERLDMLDYCDFVAMLKAARFVLADGGSIQEECSYLNKPCLIIRKTTERADGLGRNAVLWQFDDAVADQFLQRSSSHEPNEPGDLPRPSSTIIDALLERGY